MEASRQEILGLDIHELTKLMEKHGQKPYRARQLFDAVYKQRLTSLDDIYVFPKELRDELQEAGLVVSSASVEQRFVSRDGTIRYLIGFADGQSVETVWMPDGDDGEAGDGTEAGEEETAPTRFRRATICVSSQVGCAVNCKFCMTALLGLKRNLTPGEIVGQITT